MVSMRYGKNLAEGNGLVWNPGGERVEGFTNPLWVIWMAVLHLVPVAQSKMSLLVQITSLITLLVNLIFVRRIAALITVNNQVATFGAMILTALYLPLNNWSLQGLETGAITLVIAAAIWIALESLERKTFNYWLYVLLGIGTFIRIDLIIPSAMIIIFLFLVDKHYRWKHIANSVLIIGGLLAAQTALRFLYYEELLPNTYYQKMTGFPVDLRISRGVSVFWNFFIYPKRTILIFLALFLLFSKRNRYTLILLLILLGQSIYSIYVGGDVWEFWGGSNRYLVIAMPGLFILLSLAIAKIPPSFLPNMLRVVISVLLIAGSIFLLNDIGSEKGDGIKEFLLLKKPLYVDINEKIVAESLYLRSITKPGAKVAVVWAGAFSYFVDRNMIDLLGKNDKVIANEERNRNYTIFIPGHVKWDYAYSIGRLKPDVVSQLWTAPETAKVFLDRDYFEFKHSVFTHYFRKNSPSILYSHLPTEVTSRYFNPSH